MSISPDLAPAENLVRRNSWRQPNESPEYRRARDALLAEEIELRRHIERVAEQRRALPDGGEVKSTYRFEGEMGPATFAELFGDKQTLVVYNWMYGPQRDRPCPMCTALVDSWDGEVPHIRQRVALAIVGLSPIQRQLAFKRGRGWRYAPLYADLTGEFARDYHAIQDDGTDTAAFNVFTRRDGTIRHFWGEEMGFETADPGQDPRGAPDLMPLWSILDTTPEGRAPDWYPSLSYGH